MNRKIKRRILVLVIGLVIGGSGCAMNEYMSAEDQIILDLEEKYGEKFSFESWSWERYGSEDKNAHVTCESLPKKQIVAGQRETSDGELKYFDNYMAYKYEDYLKEELEETIKKVYPEARIILMLDSSGFPKTMGPKMAETEILQNKDTVISLYIVVNQVLKEELKNKQLEELRQRCEDKKLRIKGELFFTTDETAWNSISEENYSEWDYREDWYESSCQFSMDKAYEFYYADWR